MARRRRKAEADYLSYPYTPEKQLEHPSGWCITNYHKECKYQFDHGKCGCSCRVTTTPKKRGRPRKEQT